MAWYDIPGTDQDVAISTRVRFARNLIGLPFPSRMDAHATKELIGRAGEILEANGFLRVDFSEVSRLSAESFVEKRYVSPFFARESSPHALFLNEPCNLSVMVCEEDHLRIQCILPGVALRDAFDGANKIEMLLDQAFELAFDKRWGYLTASPSNVGTAMRGSVMLALPALGESGRMEAFARQIQGMGLLLRGTFGEGSSALGNLYQVSNRSITGMSEEDLLEHLAMGIQMRIDGERKAREGRYRSDPDGWTDQCRRAEGILKNAHLLSTNELLYLSGQVRCGISMGILPHIRMESLNALIVEGMPATLTLSSEPRPQTERERNILRAKTVQARLFGA